MEIDDALTPDGKEITRVGSSISPELWEKLKQHRGKWTMIYRNEILAVGDTYEEVSAARTPKTPRFAGMFFVPPSNNIYPSIFVLGKTNNEK